MGGGKEGRSTITLDAQKRAGATREHALLVGLAIGGGNRSRIENSLVELSLLTRAAGAEVVGQLIQERERPDSATLIGRGKVEAVARLSEQTGANLVVFDDDLSPAQQRNLERLTGQKTLDRTELILDIFARRARTREGRLQVELAQLDYMLPRLTGKGVLLSRLGGGIGTRGPGETKLETDRRRIRQRIQSMRREIERIRRERTVRREARLRSKTPIVALVGYTNAGKSTLFNALTRASAKVSDQLFMTLDPLVRRAQLGPGCSALLVDTVGFIQKLPTTLVAAFRATLEEITEADLIIHLMDGSADDLPAREAAVLGVLQEIGAGDRPRVMALNKIDLVADARRQALSVARPGAVALSARTGEGLAELRAGLIDRLGLAPRTVRLRFKAGEARAIAGVYAAGRVISHRIDGDEVRIDAELPERVIERFGERRS